MHALKEAGRSGRPVNPIFSINYGTHMFKKRDFDDPFSELDINQGKAKSQNPLFQYQPGNYEQNLGKVPGVGKVGAETENSASAGTVPFPTTTEIPVTDPVVLTTPPSEPEEPKKKDYSFSHQKTFQTSRNEMFKRLAHKIRAILRRDLREKKYFQDLANMSPYRYKENDEYGFD